MRRMASIRPAFSMIELVVVVVILGVIAGAIVPRFFGNDMRAAENEVRAVKDFFDVVASRSALSSQGLAVSYDASQKKLELFGLRAKGNAGDFSAQRDFLPDLMTLPVRLTETKVSSMTAGGRTVDPSKGWVEFAAGTARPTVVMVMTFGTAMAWRVELPGDESQALLTRTDVKDTGEPSMSRAVDLDNSGGTQTPW